jgi:hypothetical protein
MALSKKKADPISDRARALNDQIAALESEIKKLDTQIQRAPTPKLRSTAIPYGRAHFRTAAAQTRHARTGLRGDQPEIPASPRRKRNARPLQQPWCA